MMKAKAKSATGIAGDCTLILRRGSHKGANSRVFTIRDLYQKIELGNVNGKWSPFTVNYTKSLHRDGAYRLNAIFGLTSNGFQDTIRVTCTNGKSVLLAPDHQLWNGTEWVSAKECSVGQSIATLELPENPRELDPQTRAWANQYVVMCPIESIEDGHEVDTYNIDMDEAGGQSFIVQGVLVKGVE